MKIGIIGIGTFTLELAHRSALAGYEVIVHNPRGNGLVCDVVQQTSLNINLGSLEEASSPKVILMFVPKEDLEPVLKKLPDLTGKTIVHACGLIFDPHLLLYNISNAILTNQINASLFLGAHIVKLFKPVKFETSVPGPTSESRDEMYFTADSPISKRQIKKYLKTMGFMPIDLSGRLQIQNRIINLEGTGIGHFAAE